MKWFVILIISTIVLFITFSVACAIIVGGNADRRDEKLFEEWNKQNGGKA